MDDVATDVVDRPPPFGAEPRPGTSSRYRRTSTRIAVERLLPRHTQRVWSLLCDDLLVGLYTDNCDRRFASGDILRDDRDNRRKVIKVLDAQKLRLSVSHPDA